MDPTVSYTATVPSPVPYMGDPSNKNSRFIAIMLDMYTLADGSLTFLMYNREAGGSYPAAPSGGANLARFRVGMCLAYKDLVTGSMATTGNEIIGNRVLYHITDTPPEKRNYIDMKNTVEGAFFLPWDLNKLFVANAPFDQTHSGIVAIGGQFILNTWNTSFVRVSDSLTDVDTDGTTGYFTKDAGTLSARTGYAMITAPGRLDGSSKVAIVTGSTGMANNYVLYFVVRDLIWQ